MQLRATLPANPPLGVTVIVEVPFAPGDATVTAVPLRAKSGVAIEPLTVMGMLVVSDRDPEVPEIVAV